MTKVLERAADRLLGLVAPKEEASADPCSCGHHNCAGCNYYCSGGYLYRNCYCCNGCHWVWRRERIGIC